MPNEKPRVVLLARPAAGGIRSHLIALLARLDRTLFDITLAAPPAFIAALPRGLPEFEALALPVTARPSSLDALCAVRLASLASQGRTIVHAHGIRAGWIATLARHIKPFPLVVTLHNMPPKSRLSDLALSQIFGQADIVIAVSEAIKRRAGRESVLVIGNGIDLTAFDKLDRAAERAALHISDNTILVACAARLSPEKGVDLLIRAASHLPDISFIIAGSGPERERLERGASAKVRFVGYVRSVPALFAAADIVAIPSRSEGQGIVAIEAMAAGAAVVATNVGGLPEIVRDGITGCLTLPEDPISLVDAIGSLADHPDRRLKLASAGQAWARTNGGIDDKIAALEEAYRNLRPGRERPG
jgi:glycosyltransferase involved in cell wall biosynthesis